MEPFTVHCSSCQSRIRVRNPSMIGQIANCPKCGSMIMIAAPQQILVDSGSGQPTDSVAVTKDALPMPEEGLLASPEAFEQAFRSDGLPEHLPADPLSDSPLSEEGFAASEAVDPLAPQSWLPEPTPPPRADEESVDDSHEAREVARIRASKAKAEEAADRSRQAMIVAAIGLCSVFLACCAFLLFLRWYARPNTLASNPPAAVDVTPAQAAASAATAEPNAAGPAAAESDAAVADLAQPDVARADAGDAGDAEPAAAGGAAVPASPITPSSPTDPASGPSDSAANANQASTGTASGAPDQPAVGSGEVPTGAAASGADATSPGPNPTVAAEAGALAGQMPSIDATFDPAPATTDARAIQEKLPPGLQSFASIFDSSLVPALSDASVPLAEAPDPGDVATADAAAEVAATPVALDLPETLDQRLKQTLHGLLIQNRPLPEVLATLSMATGIPFTADLDALMAAGIARNLPINFKSAEPLTVAELLEKISSDTGLTFEPYEKKLLVVRGDTDKVKARLLDAWPVGDLVTTAEQSEALAKALGELLPELAGQFQVSDGAVRTDLQTQSPLLWYQVARVLHTWRSLRGIDHAQMETLVPAASRLPAWPVAAASQLAEKKISQIVLPEPLAQSWQRLANEVGLVCWIDWPTLESAHASPGSVAMVVSQGRSLKDLFTYYANQYHVVVALEDERTLWITTPEQARFQPRLYVLPIAGKSVDQWREELRELAPANPTDGTAMLRIIPSPDGQFVFVRCMRPTLAAPDPF
ncbi:MAG: hypothetical protein ACTHOU_18615 [Aureliella sp.]